MTIPWLVNKRSFLSSTFEYELDLPISIDFDSDKAARTSSKKANNDNLEVNSRQII